MNAQRCERLHRLDNGAMRRPSRLSSFPRTPLPMHGKCSFTSTAQSAAKRQSSGRRRAVRWPGKPISLGQNPRTRYAIWRATRAMRASLSRAECMAMPTARPRSSSFTTCASSVSRSRRAAAAGPCPRRSGQCRIGRRHRHHLAHRSTRIDGHPVPPSLAAET
jgi:hypothetical protein